MKSIPRFLALTLILALLNLGFVNLALASSAESFKASPAGSSVFDFTPEPASVPAEPQSHATKNDIKTDIDDTVADFMALTGTDPNGFANKLVRESGLDPLEDLAESKGQVDSMSNDDFDKLKGQFDKLHKKFQKRKKMMSAILNNKTLLAMLHRPSPLKYKLVLTSVPSPDNQKVVFNNRADISPALSSKNGSSAPGAYTKNLGNLNMMLVPELTATCETGPGIPNGARDLAIAKGVSLAAEIVKEFIPDDTAMVIPQNIAVGAWSVAKIAEVVLDGLHAVYLECNALKGGEATDKKLEGIKSDVSDTLGTVNTVNTNVKNNTTTLNEVNTKGDTIITNSNTIITKLGDTGKAIETSTNNITSSLTTSETNITNSITNNKNLIVNNDNSNKTDIVNNDNANRNLIITNLSNLSLRLLIETDLAAPDNSVPLALFVTPGSKGGYLELVRTIVLETIANLAGSSSAQAKSFLAQGDAALAAGNYKAAYAAYRKAYKAAAN